MGETIFPVREVLRFILVHCVESFSRINVSLRAIISVKERSNVLKVSESAGWKNIFACPVRPMEFLI